MGLVQLNVSYDQEAFYYREAFRGSISKGQSANKFIEEIEQYFSKNEKAERRVTFWLNSSP